MEHQSQGPSAALPVVEIYTDGSCRPNPGYGGWGAVFIKGSSTWTLSGHEPETTNNRMELSAALAALQSLGEAHEVRLFTDSRYLQEGITRWLAGWRLRNWVTATGEPVRNRDLWERLAREMERHAIEWQWVKGHGGDAWNILADELAGAVQPQSRLPLDDLNGVHIFLGISWKQSAKRGAWAAVLSYREHVKTVGSIIEGGTSNSLHIMSAVGGLSRLKRPLPVHVYTTSGYLRDGAALWLHQWQRRQWQTREGLAVSNREQWQMLARLLATYTVDFHLVDRELPPCFVQEAKELSRELLAGG